jgi:hypothetical protein
MIMDYDFMYLGQHFFLQHHKDPKGELGQIAGITLEIMKFENK